jgi:hypothetical protein
MKNDLTKLLKQIIDFTAYNDIISKLIEIDEEHATNIYVSLTSALKENHKAILEAQESRDKLRYLLYREAVEIKAYTSSYLSYSETMATREANLWHFALTVTEQFFNLIFDGLDDYFLAKKKIMIMETERQCNWHSTITDSSIKALGILNYAKKALKATNNYMGLGLNIDEQDVVNTNTIVEELLSKHLEPKQVSIDMAKIMEEAQKRISQVWEKQIVEQSPDFSQLKAFASNANDNLMPTFNFELGAAEQTLLVGFTGALIGTFGLAFGWHTLAYAMIHVFPPIAIFTILATLGVAFFTKERALENRIKQVEKAVNSYHKYFIVQIDTTKFSELENKTLREAMIDKSKEIITQTLRKWQEIISGNLTTEHYRIIIGATTEHLKLIDKCFDELN